MSVEAILQERKHQHGDFDTNSKFSIQLLDALKYSKLEKLSEVKRLTIMMILFKIARIVSGDPNHQDHWDDIIGYATLVKQEFQDASHTQDCSGST